MTIKEASTRLLLNGLQSWGQPYTDRIEAWQDALDAAGISVRISGSSPPPSFEGEQAALAELVYLDISRHWWRGSFEQEEAWILERLTEAAKCT